jgi:hypothetical protein
MATELVGVFERDSVSTTFFIIFFFFLAYGGGFVVCCGGSKNINPCSLAGSILSPKVHSKRPQAGFCARRAAVCERETSEI